MIFNIHTRTLSLLKNIQSKRGFAAAAVFEGRVEGGAWAGGLWSRKRVNAPHGLRIYREEINPPQAKKLRQYYVQLFAIHRIIIIDVVSSAVK